MGKELLKRLTEAMNSKFDAVKGYQQVDEDTKDKILQLYRSKFDSSWEGHEYEALKQHCIDAGMKITPEVDQIIKDMTKPMSRAAYRKHVEGDDKTGRPAETA